MALSTLLKVGGVVLALVLIVLLWLNFLRVSNLEDEVTALRADVDDLERGATPPPPPGSESPVDVETSLPFAGDPAALPPQVLALSADRAIQKAVLALTEIIYADGSRVAVPSTPVILLPQMAVQMPLPPEAACSAFGSRRPSWVLALEGGSLRIASRDCIYERPLRGRLRGVITR